MQRSTLTTSSTNNGRNSGDGNFEFIQSTADRALYKNAYDAISECGLWDWLSNYDSDDLIMVFGCTGIDNPNLEMSKINAIILNSDVGKGHTASSYSYTMHVMQFIAKYGLTMFRQYITTLVSDED